MKKIRIRRIVFVAILLSLLLTFVFYEFDKREIPPQDKIQNLVQCADQIAYLRQGTNGQGINEMSDVNIQTELDERGSDKQELLFIVKIQHRDFLGTVQVTYPAKRDSDGKLMIGVPYRNTLVYVHTKGEYICTFLICFIGLFSLIVSVLINLYIRDEKKSGKGDA
ncbi:MAG: hypothetical protein IKF97_04225 [Clostridia bacterium]|nr:hypothetical protein [Clostridia bacterium]